MYSVIAFVDGALPGLLTAALAAAGESCMHTTERVEAQK